MDKLKCISVNVRGLNTDEKRIKLYSWLNDINIDIAFLQETHYCVKNKVKINSRWFGKSIHCYTDSSYSRGVSVLFKKDLPIEILDIHRSIDGRKILVNVKLNDNIFSLVNVYAPNNESNRLDFFKKLKLFISHHCRDENNVIIAGDFNCKIAERNDKSSCKLNDIVNCFELRDIWVDKHKEFNGYTWCNGNDVPYSRIDYVFVSSDFHYCIEKIIIRRIPGSHSGGKQNVRP